jgi:DNA-binding SARP family transcriptional activator
MDRQVLVPHGAPDPTQRSGEPDRLELALLGGFRLTCHGYRMPLPLAAQRLLAFLALHLQPVLRTYVAGSLWPDSTEARSSATLRSTLWRLRRPGLPVVSATGTHLWLSDGLSVDAREVVATVRRLMDRSAACCRADLDPAPLRDELLPDWTTDDWILVERERLRQLCLHGLEAMAERLLALGLYGEAIEAGLAAVRGEPLRESAHRVLIAVHLAEGNHCEALRQYRWYEQIVREELGIEPSPRITRLIGTLRHAV